MTTQQDIGQWFDQGKREKAKFMIIVCDTFDHEDYPVYADTAAEARAKYAAHNGKNMQRVMEVYDLSLNKADQLAEHRAFHLPA